MDPQEEMARNLRILINRGEYHAILPQDPNQSRAFVVIQRIFDQNDVEIVHWFRCSRCGLVFFCDTRDGTQTLIRHAEAICDGLPEAVQIAARAQNRNRNRNNNAARAPRAPIVIPPQAAQRAPRAAPQAAPRAPHVLPRAPPRANQVVPHAPPAYHQVLPAYEGPPVYQAVDQQPIPPPQIPYGPVFDVGAQIDLAAINLPPPPPENLPPRPPTPISPPLPIEQINVLGAPVPENPLNIDEITQAFQRLLEIGFFHGPLPLPEVANILTNGDHNW